MKDPRALDQIAGDFIPLRLDSKNGMSDTARELKLPRNEALLLVLSADGKKELLRHDIGSIDPDAFSELLTRAKRIGKSVRDEVERAAARLLIAPAPTGPIRKLVDRLASDRFDEREAAERELRALGPKSVLALARLRAAEKRPEVRSRLDALLEQSKAVGAAARVASKARRLGWIGEVRLILAALDTTADDAEEKDFLGALRTRAESHGIKTSDGGYVDAIRKIVEAFNEDGC